ncbi:DUF2621 domain-containing protein [Microaerobacter geothermalis]|nr:DUF2621 family protein [Microaerobacter geothermalis]MCF6095254.1 DUF2621 domain-containing protein [Microaerobacter geothermalis]
MNTMSLAMQWAVILVPATIVVLILIGGFFMFRKFLRNWPKNDKQV